MGPSTGHVAKPIQPAAMYRPVRLVENTHSQLGPRSIARCQRWATDPRHRPHLIQRLRLLLPRGLSTAKAPDGAAVQEFNLDRNAEVGGVLIRGVPAAGSTEPALRNR